MAHFEASAISSIPPCTTNHIDEEVLRVREHERLAAVILDGMYQLVALLNVEGQILEVNRAALDGAGHKIHEICGKPFWTARWWQVSRKVQEELQLAIKRAAAAEFVRYEVEIYGDKMGLDQITIDFSLQPIRGDSGEVEYLLAEGRNITARKKAEEQVVNQARELRQLNERLTELDHAKTQFFANVSHEFRTPLTLMLGPLEDALANAHGILPPGAANDLQVSHRSAQRLLKLVNTMLDFSRIEAGRVQAAVQPTSLASFTRDLASNFRSACNKAGLVLIVDCSLRDEHVPVYVDRDMWEKIVLNLLSNAFKFTLKGSIEVRLQEFDDNIELAITDTGSGIPEAELPHIFERFHRVESTRGRSFEGSGIGLALVRELVQLHGGSVSVESVQDQGSTFRVTLPKGILHVTTVIAEPALDKVSISSRADGYVEEAMGWIANVEVQNAPTVSLRTFDPFKQAGSEGNKRPTVLLADDNADMREYIQRLLQGRYRVLAVTNGKEALEATLRELPDLVLTDVMMPVMDGFELLAAIRSHPAISVTPIVMLSARAGEDARIEGYQSGADDYLVKPFTERELLARIGSSLALSALRKELIEQERVHVQQELNQSRDTAHASALFASIVQSSDDAIISKDLHSVVTSWNRGAERMFGFTSAEAVGKSITILIPEERLNEEPEIMSRIHAGESVEHYETVRVRKDGTLLDISLTVSPVFNSQGFVVGASKIARDISERKRFQTTLLKAHGLAAAGRMSASIAHEINNPLEAVTNLLYLLRSEVADEEGKKHLAMAESEVARLAQITRKTLSYYRDTSMPAPVDLSQLITESLSVFTKKIEDKQLVVNRTEQHSTVDGLRGELRQLFVNLITNAIDVVDICGQIDIVICTASDATYVKVRDNGRGISPEHQSKLFEPFFTTKDQHMGTGLGLWISKEIAQKHGAAITVESCTHPVAHGTTFTVRFVRAPQ